MNRYLKEASSGRALHARIYCALIIKTQNNLISLWSSGPSIRPNTIWVSNNAADRQDWQVVLLQAPVPTNTALSDQALKPRQPERELCDHSEQIMKIRRSITCINMRVAPKTGLAILTDKHPDQYLFTLAPNTTEPALAEQAAGQSSAKLTTYY